VKVTKQQKQPTRSCTACGQSATKQQLVRFVRDASGKVFCDGSGRAAGRGAYLCADPQCFVVAQKKDRLSRALKCNVTNSDYERLQIEYLELSAGKGKLGSEVSMPAAPVVSTE
jgi:predicted RNA-binding protein YlxR (DUF448 family)